MRTDRCRPRWPLYASIRRTSSLISGVSPRLNASFRRASSVPSTASRTRRASFVSRVSIVSSSWRVIVPPVRRTPLPIFMVRGANYSSLGWRARPADSCAPRSFDSFADEGVDEGRPEEHLPVQGDFDGRHTGDLRERVRPCGEVAEALRTAEEIFPRRVNRLVNQDGIPDHATEIDEGRVAGDEQMVHEIARVLQETEPWNDKDRLVPHQALHPLPHRLGAQSRGGRELCDGRAGC